MINVNASVADVADLNALIANSAYSLIHFFNAVHFHVIDTTDVSVANLV